MARQCMLCRVSGRVQGVFFRASTREQARRLGLEGYARNLADGSVEVYACGEPKALAALQAWLHEGPEMAWVEAVSCREAEDSGVHGFRTG